MTQTRINIRTLVNSSGIRRERREGREVIVVPSATLPDNIVMNGIRYPSEEIEKSFMGLNNTPAPLGHPLMAGKFLSAYDPRAIPKNSIGAWNENVRRENGRVFIDKVIDVEFANQLESGRKVLNAIEQGKPIHTSTGLLAVLRPVSNVDGVKSDAVDMVFDHDAILLDVDGAATPEQGVGMLVNSATDLNGNSVDVVNSALEDAERELDWAVEQASRAVEKLEKVPLLEKIKSAIIDAIRGGEKAPTTIEKESEMTVTKEQFDALAQQVTDMQAGIATTVANSIQLAVQPLIDAQTAVANAAKATEDAELATLRAQIVAGHLMNAEAAGELTINSARALASTLKTRPAAALSNRMAEPGSAPAYSIPD